MPLQKQPVTVNFSKGIDTKSDKWQIPIGNFFYLINSVFTKAGELTKRAGFANLLNPPTLSQYVTTFRGNLLSIGKTLYAYIQGTLSWTTQGTLNSVALSVVPLEHSRFVGTTGGAIDGNVINAARSPNNLTVTAYYHESSPIPPTRPNGYTVTDSVTGQYAIPYTGIPDALFIKPFVFQGKFVLVYVEETAGPSYALRYITIDYSTLAVTSPVTIAAPLSTIGAGVGYFSFDGVVFQNNLYLVYNSGADQVEVVYLDSSFVVSAPTVLDATTTFDAVNIVGSSDSGGTLWVSYTRHGVFQVRVAALSSTLGPSVPPLASTAISVLYTEPILGITSIVSGGVLTAYYTVANGYSFDPTITTPFIATNTISLAGTVGTEVIFKRSVALNSKVFLIDGIRYMFCKFYSPNDQSSYFLLQDTDRVGQVVSRVDYGNAGLTVSSPEVYITPGEVSVYGEFATLAYDTIVVLGPHQASAPVGVFNLAGEQVTFNMKPYYLGTTETGNNLSLTGGFLWTYDALLPNENNFFLFPDPVTVTGDSTPGGLTNQLYTYQVVYQWSDSQGTIIRSSPSIPVSINPFLVGATATNVNVATMRLSYKSGIAIEIYRASTDQPTFYFVASVNNDPTVDDLTYIDLLSDAQILGSTILYTTGGVVGNTSPPSTSILTVWDDRVWLVDAEDPNQLWFSKQVIEDVPVEMSDLLTYFVAPSIGSQGPTGPVTGLFPLDDKLIVFKANAVEYINGSGPDNTGANNNYSQPIFVTSTSGCITQSSIAVTPVGLLYQADKGIWLLGRDLTTKYIGAPVENYTQLNVVSKIQPLVVSAIAIPDTTQVRFMMDTGVILMYDYFYNEWGTFEGVTAGSSTLYQGLHTFSDIAGTVSQETPNAYADALGTPVLMSFQTGWINLAGLQGYERFYYFYLLGEYLSPHTLQIQLGYDYLTVIEQTDIITPAQIAPIPPDPRLGDIEQWRIFPHRGKCQAFQITFTEQSDTAGPGLTLSGLDIVIGKKKGYPVRRQNLSVGS